MSPRSVVYYRLEFVSLSRNIGVVLSFIHYTVAMGLILPFHSTVFRQAVLTRTALAKCLYSIALTLPTIYKSWMSPVIYNTFANACNTIVPSDFDAKHKHKLYSYSRLGPYITLCWLAI